MENKDVLQQLNMIQSYVKVVDEKGYQLIDLNMVEPLDVNNKNDRIVFERNGQLYSIRSDWTQSILNYNKNFELANEKVAYYGPVIRNNRTQLQAGVELFKANLNDMIESIQMHLDFVEEQSGKKVSIIVINDDDLLDKLLEKLELNGETRALIVEKNLSELGNTLGKDHIVYKLMTVPVSQQFQMVNDLIGDTDEMQVIHQLRKAIKGPDTRFILDVSFRSPQTYYNGLYFQAYLDQNAPILSGGQYASGAFGIGIDILQGGVS